MKILFTGASSFSGMWFVKELASAGHQVTAVFRRSLEAYTGLRRQRINQLFDICTPVFGASFGDAAFLAAIVAGGPWDIFCHHAAEVNNYKSPDYNAAAALANNTHNIKGVLQTLKEAGCERVLLSGSVFEQSEGAGSSPLRAFSPYGLSKGMTADSFAFYTSILGMKLGKFVIANPFGPYEEARFTTYLIQSWLEGKTASVNAPRYVRDNVPVTLLAKAYRHFALQFNSSSENLKINPSCYVESQEIFTRRFSAEMQRRLDMPCPFDIRLQQDFSEPLIRINTDPLDWAKLGWYEKEFWDELAIYYRSESLSCQQV
jgi:UDP-glucose 4-epimerase